MNKFSPEVFQELKCDWKSQKKKSELQDITVLCVSMLNPYIDSSAKICLVD